MKVKIQKLGINGEGIAYQQRKPIFIANGLPGEIVEVKITEENPKYAFGEIVDFETIAYARVDNPCQEPCNACTLMHMHYEDQLVVKQDLLKETLHKYSKVDITMVESTLASPNELGYRNALKLPFMNYSKQLALGMYQSGTNIPKAVNECLVHEPELEKMKSHILRILNQHQVSAYDKKLKKGMRYLILRGLNKHFQATLVTGEDVIDKVLISKLMEIKGLESLWQSINTAKNTVDLFGRKMVHLAGKRKLGFNMKGKRFYLSPKSFFQLNTKQAEQLYEIIGKLIDGKPKLLVEAYCGIGAMSIYNAERAERVIGIETIPEAIANANQSAKINKLDNIEFICADAGKTLASLSEQQEIDYLIVDPPRVGLDDKMLVAIKKHLINNIIYISCNPATLARNLAILSEEYEVERIIPVDMFPNTAHVETVVLMSRVKE